MHGGEEDDQISNYYGIWPGIAGLLIAAAIIWFMFYVADGFA
ncbi:MAG: hypothetical protein AAFQ45_10855 [Pseudomonadota bacterium]